MNLHNCNNGIKGFNVACSRSSFDIAHSYHTTLDGLIKNIARYHDIKVSELSTVIHAKHPNRYHIVVDKKEVCIIDLVFEDRPNREVSPHVQVQFVANPLAAPGEELRRLRAYFNDDFRDTQHIIQKPI